MTPGRRAEGRAGALGSFDLTVTRVCANAIRQVEMVEVLSAGSSSASVSKL